MNKCTERLYNGLVKDGASGDNDIQALSGATITSTAVTNAMNAALYLIGSAAE